MKQSNVSKKNVKNIIVKNNLFKKILLYNLFMIFLNKEQEQD